MSRYKDFLIGLEELIYEAMELGFTDLDGIYAYVYMKEPLADRVTVENILSAHNDDMRQYVASTN